MYILYRVIYIFEDFYVRQRTFHSIISSVHSNLDLGANFENCAE